MNARFLVHKRRIAIIDNFIEQQVSIRNKHGILLIGKFFNLHCQVG